MTATPNYSARIRNVSADRLLRFIVACETYGDAELLRQRLRISKATQVRIVRAARQLGCVIAWNQVEREYRLLDAGPFNVAALKKVLR